MWSQVARAVCDVTMGGSAHRSRDGHCWPPPPHRWA
jgi:hypothetical protein